MIVSILLWTMTGLALVISIWLLYLRLFHVNIPRMLLRFETSERYSAYNVRFPNILDAFLGGNNRVIRPVIRMSGVRKFLETSDVFYKGFAYEGTGMGFGAKASLWPGKGRRFESYIRQLDPNYLYQYYVGLGWWLHLRYHFRFRGYRKWLSTLDPRYASIVFDGVGFKTALFNLQLRAGVDAQFSAFPHDYIRVCYQGFGRGIWFAAKFQIDEAIEIISRVPEPFRKDAYSGLGLAIAYSFFDNIIFAFDAVLCVPVDDRTAFRQGIAFGWEARQLQDKTYWKRQLDKYPTDIADRARRYITYVHVAEQMLDYNDYTTQYYTRWMDGTRALIEKGDV